MARANTIREQHAVDMKVAKKRAGRKRKEVDDPIDIYVGSRIRTQRTILGMSQEKLGAALGMTFQQVQKYEKGSNRVGSSNLYRLSTILGVPVGWFFDGYSTGPAIASQIADDGAALTRRALELCRYMNKLPDAQQLKVFALVKTMADAVVMEA